MRKSILVILLLFSLFYFNFDSNQEWYNFVVNEQLWDNREIEEEHILFFDSDDDYLAAIRFNPLVKYPYLRALKFEGLPNINARSFAANLFERSFRLHDIDLDATIFANNQTDKLNMGALDTQNFTGKGIKIGVIDTGVDFSHPLLSHLNYTRKDFNEGNSISYGHGTEVVSCIAGFDMNNKDRYGVAISAHIVSATMGTLGNNQITGDWLGAFDFMIESNVTVINTSFSGEPEYWDPIIRRLHYLNITLVGSVGNDGQAGEGNDRFTAEGPGSHELAFGIGGIDTDYSLSDFTSEGPTHSQITKPDFVEQASVLAAISSSNIGVRSGTSFASPLFAGAIAVLISGLNYYDIPYTPDGLKSQLMDHAELPVGLIDEYSVGHGLANFSATFLDIVNNGFDSIQVTPSNVPYDFQVQHNRGCDQDIYARLFTSMQPEMIKINVTGNISIVLEQTGNITRQNQRLPLVISSTNSTLFGIYNGSLKFYSDDSNKTAELSIKVNVVRDCLGSILFDLKYTDFDWKRLDPVINKWVIADRMFGFKTGSALKFLWENGFVIKENFDHLSTSSLVGIDILWLPDLLPVTIWDEGVDMWNATIESVINDFVAGGGSVFIDFMGYYTIGNDYSEFSTDIYAIDSLLANWNIKPNEIAYDENNYISGTINTMIVLNNSIIGKNVDQVTYKGNYLQMIDENDLWSDVLVRNDYQIGVMSYDMPSAGRVIVSSSNYWMDNCAIDSSACITPPYDNEAKNRIFLNNTFQWLASENRLSIGNISSSFGLLKGEIISDGDPEMYLSLGPFTIGYQMDFVNIGTDTYSFNHSISKDDEYSAHIYSDDEYIFRNIRSDYLSPEIDIQFDPLLEIYGPTEFVFLVTERFLDQVSVKVDGNEISTSITKLTDRLHQVSVIIDESDDFLLDIVVTDGFSHSSSISHLINVKESSLFTTDNTITDIGTSSTSVGSTFSGSFGPSTGVISEDISIFHYYVFSIFVIFIIVRRSKLKTC